MTAIGRRPLGTTDLMLSELGFGAGTLGNLYRAIPDDVARAAVAAALDLGIRYVDTAPHYGRGLSERRVGDAVRLAPDVVVSTKVGRLMVPDASVDDDRQRDGFRSPMPFRMTYDYGYDGILRSHEDSLQRLGLARIDIIWVHDIGQYTHGDAAAGYWEQLFDGGGFRALQRLRDEGAIRAFGIGVNEVDVCLDVLRRVHLDAILLAGRYTLLEQRALDALMPACQAAKTSIVIGGPYNSGILASGVRGGTPAHYDYAPPPPEVMSRVAAIEAVADDHGVPLAAAALRFVLAHPAVASVIPGIDGPERARRTVELYDTPVPAAFWEELRHRRLLREDAPVPSADGRADPAGAVPHAIGGDHAQPATTPGRAFGQAGGGDVQ